MMENKKVWTNESVNVAPIFTYKGERRDLDRAVVESMLGGFKTSHHAHASQLYYSNFPLGALAFERPTVHQAKVVRDLFIVKQPEVRQAFEAERAALEVCNRSENPRIIMLMASFESDQVGYLLLPAATTDLASFWRRGLNNQQSSTIRTSDECWMISELRGLATAISTLHTKLKPSNGGRLWCVHGDVKASNILLFQKPSNSELGTLQLADFGSSQLFGTSSEVADVPTEGLSGSYAAPESALGLSISPATDVWGLGCVFLEAVVWLLRGSDGLEAFTDLRMHQSYPYDMDLESDHFFRIEPSRPKGRYVSPWINAINPGVAACISDLKKHERCSAVITNILNLVESRMLLVDPHQRLAAEDLCLRLESI